VPGGQCTVNGIGERAGNAPLHTTVMILKELYGVAIPGFRYDMLWPLRRKVEEFSGLPVGATEPIIGHNVFSHETGIHTAGITIHPAIYQVIEPETVGGQLRFLFGKHSGAMAIEAVLQRHGEELKAAGVEVTPLPETVALLTTEPASRSACWIVEVALHGVQPLVAAEQARRGRDVAHRRVHGPAVREQPAHEVVAVLAGGAGDDRAPGLGRGRHAGESRRVWRYPRLGGDRVLRSCAPRTMIEAERGEYGRA